MAVTVENPYAAAAMAVTVENSEQQQPYVLIAVVKAVIHESDR